MSNFSDMVGGLADKRGYPSWCESLDELPLPEHLTHLQTQPHL